MGELGVALVVHARNAEHYLFEVLCELVPVQHPVHVHCYTDSLDQCLHLCDAWENLMIGFTGCVTFGGDYTKGKGKGQSRGTYRGHPHDKPEHFEELLRYVPVERMLIETD